MLILLNKPYGYVTQFSGDDNNLSQLINIPGIYPAGRLDKDSEGLLILTDDGKLQHILSHPKHQKKKVYWVQVEGQPDEQALDKLRQGVMLKDGITQPATVRIIKEPDIWSRNPPIRFRANIPTSWLELTISEGKNRQVRRMTAAIGYPTLRLIRYAIGDWKLDGLQPGEWRKIEASEYEPLLKDAKTTPDRRRHYRKKRTFSSRRRTYQRSTRN